ncbi:dynein heavy chain domain-containing protein 1-like [Oopsacas minuta]|uniref:Dynein heavy chain domain-containing protein 1-like n=1 Tax=Oopsacas minuta TaxID=111878 RepID=A0AAV7K9S9_9METZ|nr:dynein heavy chain domain-containing protein 1-like [Oopsacas minuta]
MIYGWDPAWFLFLYLFKCLKSLPNFLLVSRFAHTVVTKWNDILQRFNSYLPSLELLVDPGMKTHFWQVLFTALGCVFPTSGVIPSINRLIFLDILTHRELIKHIHASAMVEGRLEDVLRLVILNWKSREYKLVKHKAAPFHGAGNERKERDNLMYLSQQQGFISYVLQDPEEFLSSINDDSTRLHMMVLSNCTQSLKKRAQLWIDKLQQLTEFITIWMDCQAKWIYISSVYVEFAVLGTHTQEVERFKQLNTNYQSLVNTLFENKKMLHLIGVRVEANLQLVEDTNYLIGRLMTQQRELSEMMKYMKNMVEEARKIFSRAFYLSQQQILYLYIHTGNPKALLPQLKLCFPGVHNVVWVADSSADKLSSLGDVNRESIYL